MGTMEEVLTAIMVGDIEANGETFVSYLLETRYFHKCQGSDGGIPHHRLSPGFCPLNIWVLWGRILVRRTQKFVAKGVFLENLDVFAEKMKILANFSINME